MVLVKILLKILKKLMGDLILKMEFIDKFMYRIDKKNETESYNYII